MPTRATPPLESLPPTAEPLAAGAQPPAKATTLGEFFMELTHFALLKQATKYCAAFTDWAVHSVYSRLAEPQPQMAELFRSLLVIAAEDMPGNQSLCSMALGQLQEQVKAVWAVLQVTWYGEATPETLVLERTCSESSNDRPTACGYSLRPPLSTSPEPLEPEVSVDLMGTWNTMDHGMPP